MKDPRTYVMSLTSTAKGDVSPVSVGTRRTLSIEAGMMFAGEAEAAAVLEFRLAWRTLQRRIRKLEDAQ